MKVTILGNGVAGMSAAEAARAGDPDCEIAVFSEECRHHYSRPRIIEYLAGKVSAEKIVIRDEAYYRKNRISLSMPAVAREIDRVGKKVFFSDGRIETYDKLILATGAHSFLPPLPGVDAPGVFTLRTIDDADRIREFAKGRKTAIVVGAGLLGIESAMSLRSLGLSTTLVEVYDRLLPRQLDGDGAAMMQSLLEKRGLTFSLARKTICIERAGESLVLRFEKGEPLSADIVLFSSGVRPNLDIASNSGIGCERGILVDEYMSTNYKDVYAAGDVAQFKGILYGIWPAARDQGVAAGLNAIGKRFAYSGSVAATKLKVTGIDFASIGSFEVSEEISSLTQKSDSSFERLFLKGNTLQGAILIGDSSRYIELQNLVKSQYPIERPESLFAGGKRGAGAL